MRKEHPRSDSDPGLPTLEFPTPIPSYNPAGSSETYVKSPGNPSDTLSYGSPGDVPSYNLSSSSTAATDAYSTLSPASTGSYTSAVTPTGYRSRAASFGLSQPNNAGSSQVPLAGAAFRRHHRQRSSTIYIAPRPVPPVSITGTVPVPNGLVRGVTTLAFAQVLAKLLAFALNQVLYRFLGARDLGAASQLDLLVSTALVLSRDAIRLASQRQTVASVARASGYTTDARAMLGTLVGTYQETSNLGWLSVGLGWLIVSLISGVMYLSHTWDSRVLMIASSASLIELLSEPGFLVLQLKIQLAERARAETVANMARVFVVAISLLFFHLNAFMGFALGHLGYSLTLTAFIFHITRREALNDGFSLLPTKVWNGADQTRLVYVSDSVWRTSLELGAQQVVKFLLTEGDKLAVGVMTTLEEQGEYALAANYGSLLARMVFSPVEEALRSYFSRARNSGPSPSTAKTEGAVIEEEPSHTLAAGAPPMADTGTTDSEPGSSRTLSEMMMVLSSTLRAYAYLGIFAAGFGPQVAQFIIGFLVRSDKFSSAGKVLAVYAYYIPVLAWNGVLESLVQSTAPLNVLRSQGSVLSVLTLLFVALTYVFVSCLHLGGAGIVWAQLYTMLLRIAWSLRYTNGYFSRLSQLPATRAHWISMCFPNIYVLGTSVLAVGSSRILMPSGVDSFRKFVVLIGIATVTTVPVLLTEGRLIKQLFSKLKSKRKTQ